MLNVNKEITFRDKKIGNLYIGVSLDELNTAVKNSYFSISIISIIVFIIGFVMVIIISTIITEPIIKMVETIDQITTSDLSKRAVISSDDEVGHLGKSFNLLVDKLEQAYNYLKKLNENLNEKVRTQLLTQNELLMTQKELSKALLEEKELNELKSRFISMVSHEYRSPLTVILSATHLLNEFFKRQDRENFEKYLNRINLSVNHMVSLIENALTFGKIEKKVLETEISELNLIEIITDIIKK
jgi:signal transduction histidine kinase